jgi:hypothetical protein
MWPPEALEPGIPQTVAASVAVQPAICRDGVPAIAVATEPEWRGQGKSGDGHSGLGAEVTPGSG